MRAVAILTILLVLGLLQAIYPKQPVIQNQESATKTQQSQTPEARENPDRRIDKSVDGPIGQVNGQNEKAASQSDTTENVYAVKVVSQPPNKTDWGVITSIILSGALVAIAFGTLLFYRKQLKLDQRAWVGIHRVSGVLEIAKSYNITITLKNTGKTPAKKVSILETSRSVRKDEPMVFTHNPDDTLASASTFIPNSRQRIRKSILPKNEVTSEVVDPITNEEFRYVVYGTLKYEDIFKDKHWMTYYFWLAPDGKGYIIGPDHNDTGDGDPPPE